MVNDNLVRLPVPVEWVDKPRSFRLAAGLPTERLAFSKTGFINSGRLITCLHFDFDFDMPLAILLAVTDPDVLQSLPIISAFLNREPRTGHKVDPFQSQPNPQVI